MSSYAINLRRNSTFTSRKLDSLIAKFGAGRDWSRIYWHSNNTSLCGRHRQIVCQFLLSQASWPLRHLAASWSYCNRRVMFVFLTLESSWPNRTLLVWLFDDLCIPRSQVKEWYEMNTCTWTANNKSYVELVIHQQWLLYQLWWRYFDTLQQMWWWWWCAMDSSLLSCIFRYSIWKS